MVEVSNNKGDSLQWLALGQVEIVLAPGLVGDERNIGAFVVRAPVESVIVLVQVRRRRQQWQRFGSEASLQVENELMVQVEVTGVVESDCQWEYDCEASSCLWATAVSGCSGTWDSIGFSCEG